MNRLGFLEPLRDTFEIKCIGVLVAIVGEQCLIISDYESHSISGLREDCVWILTREDS